MKGFSVTVNTKKPAEAERIFNALADKATVAVPLGETFFAAKFAILTDKFGTPWMIVCEKPQ